MRIITAVLFVALLPYSSMAGDETLLSGEIESGGYGGPLCQIGEINGSTGVFVGGQGGWIINHRFVLGGKGYALVNSVDAEDSPNLKLEFGCGGVMFEYMPFSEKLLHLSIHSMIGAGGVRYVVEDYQTDDDDDVNYNEDAFFVLEPGVDEILNVTKVFRIGAGVAYRYVSDVEYEDLTNSDLSGVSGQVVLRFGVF